MSFEPVMTAIQENPELAQELKDAKTPKERAAILDAHGIEKPHAESEFPEVSGVGGGSSSPSTATDILIGASAVGAAA